jgi:peptidoglycan hydrolase CwlO-like protein
VSNSVWITLSAGVVGALIGAVATIVAAVITRQPSLTAVVDDRIRVLLEHYERTIKELRGEIAQLESKVDYLSAELNKVRSEQSAG